jgi:predicted ester cyclase
MFGVHLRVSEPQGRYAMSIEDNKRVVRIFFEDVWNRNDASKLDEILSSENKYHVGTNMVRAGPNEARAIIENWRRGFADFQYHVEDIIAEGDRVVSRVRFTGTHTGNFEIEGRNLGATNSKIEGPEIFIMRVAAGKIVEMWTAWDRLGVLRQLGAVL